MKKINNISDFLKDPKVINYVIIPLVVVISIMALYVYIFEPFDGKSETVDFTEKTNADVINTSTPVLNTGKKDQSILDVYQQSKEDSINSARINSDINLSDGGTQQKENTFVANDFYEVDPQTKQLIEQLEEQEKLIDERNATTTTKRSSGSYSSPNRSSGSAQKSQEEDSDDAYLEELIKGRQEMLQHYEDSNKQYQNNQEQETTETKELVEFRASIYQDQYILPGDRVKLVLSKDLVYNGKLFQKGTFIYAFAGMGPSRVFLEVDNIAHIPIELAAKDITDGRMGIYSTRAGELWFQYKDELKNDVNQDVASAASDVTGSSFLGSALRGLSNFFKKKKISKRDKILLINDHEVILTNKTN